MQKLAVGAIAGMRHEVDLGEAGHLDIPPVRLQRNLMLAQLALEGAQAAIHVARAHRPQPRGDVARNPPAPTRPGNPRGQQRLQAD